MKKKVLVAMLIVVSLIYGVYWAFFDMSRLPKEELISEVQSPNGKYSIKAYLSKGASTTAPSVLGELNFNNSNKKPKNIYWNYREDKVEIKWIDDSTVIINGHKLNVPDEIFDFRRNN